MRLFPISIGSCVCALGLAFGWGAGGPAYAQLQLGQEQFVQANNADIAVSGYSVPAFDDWNGDGRPDLLVGEGGNNYAGKVRMYLNTGTPSSPAFGQYSYVKANGTDISLSGSGCLGAFPRMWDAGTRKDLLVGGGDGKVRLYHNIGSDTAPAFDAGSLLQYGPAGSKTNINVSARATCSQVDWNNDGCQDLMVGALSGYVYVYLNQGTNADPDFASQLIVQSAGAALRALAGRSSPVFADLDNDGLNDLLLGDTNGQLTFYKNTGSLSSPGFAVGTAVLNSAGQPFDLDGTLRSRPFVCDWNGDGQLDVLVGYGDGKVHLYAMNPEPATLCLVGAGVVLMFRRRRRGSV